jgi:O-antigen/teichoic acid export membrane protein
MSVAQSNTEIEVSLVTPAEPATARWQQRARSLLSSDLARKVLETYATQIALILIGLLTTIAVARTLGPAGRGLYAVALAIGQIGVQLGHIGLVASNTYYLAQNRSLLPRLLANSLLISLAVGLGAIVAGLVIFRARPDLAPVHGTLLVLGLLYIPFGLAFLFGENLLLALHQVRSYNQIEFANRLLILLLVGAVILSGRVAAQSVLTAVVAVMFLSCVAAMFMLRPHLHELPRVSLQLLRRHAGVGVKAYLIILFSYLLLRIDLLMVKYMLGAEQAGYYSVASSMGDYLLMLPGVIGMILFPKLSAMQDWREKLRLSRKAAYGMLAALLPLLVIAGVAAPFAIRILFGRAFLPAVSAFLWLLPGILTLGIETVAVQFLNALGYPRIVVVIWGFSVLLNVAGNFWAIPHLGLQGASLMSSLSYTLTLLAILIVIHIKERNLANSYGC